MTTEQLYIEYLKTRTVTTDSRHITPGCLFFALKGDHFDGNAFATQALADGAALSIVDDPAAATDDRCVLVDNVLSALQDLARYHRAQLSIPVIGITGTNGKTTTKELVHAVLAKRYRTHATQGNFNNHLGVPLTLLSMPADTEMLIVEMGANHPFEIDFLCRIANPEFGLITNVGKAHLEGFGSFKEVVKTKCELYRHLAAMAGTIFVDADNPILTERAEAMAVLPASPAVLQGIVPAFQTVTPTDYTNLIPRGVNMPMASVIPYGSAASAEFKGAFVSADPYLKFYFEDDDNVYTVQTQLLGSYNFSNAMAAVAVGRYFGVELFDIKTALEEYCPVNNRSQYKRTGRNELVLDCYNANPSSMKVAVDNFAAMHKDHKVVILGGMKELGAESRKEHKALLEQVVETGFERVFLVGDEFRQALDDLKRPAENISLFADTEAARDYFRQSPLAGNTVLVKGSNSNRLWQLEEVL